MKFKRFMGLVLAVLMVMSCFTVGSFAATQSVQKTKSTEVVFGTPTIDGTLTGTEWDNAVKVDFPYDRNNCTAANLAVPMTYEEGKAPYAMTMWDDNYLYAYFRVYDDAIITTGATDSQVYLVDSIELYIDELNDKGLTKAECARFYQITARADGTAQTSTDNQYTADDYETNINETEGYYEVELRYAWHTLVPANGDVIGIDFAINNTNEADATRDNSLSWNDQTNELYKAPVYAGVATLTGGSSAVKYSVTYDANGGTNAPARQVKEENVDLILTNSVPTRGGFKFMGWATEAGGEVVYAAGATYTANADVTLYAVWEADENIVMGNVVSDYTNNLWTFNKTTKVLTITSNKTGYNESGAYIESGGWADILTEIEEVVLIGNISKITGHAFNGASNLKKITMTKNVKQIDGVSLYGCSKLETICVAGSPVMEGVLDFSNIVGSNAKGYSSFAKADVFNGNTAATAIILSAKYSNVPSVEGDETSAPSLKKGNLPDNLETIYGATEYLEAFAAENGYNFVPFGKSTDGNIYWTIEDGVMTLVGDGALNGLDSDIEEYAADVTSVVIPATITEIAGDALAALTALESATFEGDAPVVAEGAKPFGEQSAEFVVKAKNGAEGFDGETWCGYTVYVPVIAIGDVTEDGSLDSADLVALAQYIALWSVEINTSVADVNGSGSIDSADLVLLAQAIAGWDVTLVGPPSYGDNEVNYDKIK